MIAQDTISKQHNGLIKCPWHEAFNLMPDIAPILDSAPVKGNNWYVDVKVHMLMPNMYPCIPNWHGDAIPRDENGNLKHDLCDEKQTMYLWLSGPPLTEFEDGREVKPQTWIPFKQKDIHRGTPATNNTWRIFIRLMPKQLVARPRTGQKCLRRHSQVYLDANHFIW